MGGSLRNDRTGGAIAAPLLPAGARARAGGFFQPGLAPAPAVNWEPPVDVFESEQELTIVAALPGVEPQDIELAVERGVLLVAGVRRMPACAHRAAIHRMEIPHGRFERRIRLPGEGWQLGRSTLVNGCLVLSIIPQR